MTLQQNSVQLIEAGPWHVVGLSIVARVPAECAALWQNQLLPRMCDIQLSVGGIAVGICRCAAGAPAGSFEYLAGFQAEPDAPVPAGMTALDLPRAHYLVLPVAGLAEVSKVWSEIPQVLAQFPGWEPYCSPAGCQCATHASFEYYPPEFRGTGRFSIYVPVKQI